MSRIVPRCHSAFLLDSLVALAVCGAALAAESAGPAGRWNGAIELPGAKLDVEIDLAADPSGAWTGDVSIPAQGARDLPLETIVASGDAISFAIAGVPGAPTFRGALSGDGTRIEGTFTQGGQSFPFALSRAAGAEESARDALAGVDELVEGERRDFKVPGLAVAVVRDGRVVYAKGFGTRDAAKELPVTPKTLFAIGSSTKAFTTFVMATLVDEGKLDWDAPVRRHLPSFRLPDPSASERITPRDLVTHRSGLPRHDLVWYNSEATRAELVARLAFLAPNADLRAKWQYNNLMFLTAGVLVEQVTGTSWEEAVRKRIFEPLGMTASNFSVEESKRAPDFALPHRESGGKIGTIPFRDISTIGPAGSINSSVEDMARWAAVHTSGGRFEGRTIVRRETLDDLHAPHMTTGTPQERPEISPPAYGLGWFVATYRGHERVEHGGNIDGFTAQVTLFPADGLGIVVLANRDGTPLPPLLANHLADRLLGLPPIDWNGEALRKLAVAEGAQQEAAKKKDSVRRPGTSPSHPLADYAGEYEHPGYGIVKIGLAGGRLDITYNRITASLDHWHYDVFRATTGARDPAIDDTKFLFRTNVKGDVDAVSASLEPAVDDIVFRRQPDSRLQDPAYLRRFLGEYDVAGQTVRIELQGSWLTLSVPGQPLYRLRPDRNDEFELEGASGYSVRFVSDGAGAVVGLESRQPNGVFTAKRKS